jgi:hypothetical protein
MDQIQKNNSNTSTSNNIITEEEILNLHGEDLEKTLTDRLQSHTDEVDQIYNPLADICEDVKNMPDIDEAATDEEDNIAISEMLEKLDDDLTVAAVDLATDDEILQKIDKE